MSRPNRRGVRKALRKDNAESHPVHIDRIQKIVIGRDGLTGGESMKGREKTLSSWCIGDRGMGQGVPLKISLRRVLQRCCPSLVRTSAWENAFLFFLSKRFVTPRYWHSTAHRVVRFGPLFHFSNASLLRLAPHSALRLRARAGVLRAWTTAHSKVRNRPEKYYKHRSPASPRPRVRPSGVQRDHVQRDEEFERTKEQSGEARCERAQSAIES